MAQRKTINVELLKDMHERMTRGSLENPRYISNKAEGMATRMGINIMLETALHETGNYKGFSYLLDYREDDSARLYN